MEIKRRNPLGRSVASISKIVKAEETPMATSAARLDLAAVPSLHAKWSPLAMLAFAALACVDIDLARNGHKLAGNAGMFGEIELGEKTATPERALRAGV